MPAAHSKRNTSLAFFTAHERSQLSSTWGTQSTRLTRDSFLPFGSCTLCLLPATDPVACHGARKTSANMKSNADGKSNGKKRSNIAEICHVFCRECAMSNLLAQKKELKRLDRTSAAREAEDVEGDAREADAAKARAIEDFEQVQLGLTSRSGVQGGETGRRLNIVGKDDATGKVTLEEEVEADGISSGKKRKHITTLTESELLALANEDDRAKYRKVLEDSKAKTGHSGSFWIPAQTPESAGHSTGKEVGNKTRIEKSQPLCPGSTDAASEHPFSLKTFVSVKFSGDKSATKKSGGAVNGSEARAKDNVSFTCPSCTRPLSNAGKAILAKPCGHVLCASCVDKFLFAEENEGEVRCFVCNEDLVDHGVKPKDKEKQKEKHKDKDRERMRPGLVEISSEGTGYAGGGNNMARLKGTAFQC